MEAILLSSVMNSKHKLGEWLLGLHNVVSSKELVLPDWCLGTSFASVQCSREDDEKGTWVLAALDSSAGGTANPVAVRPARLLRLDARPGTQPRRADSAAFILHAALRWGSKRCPGQPNRTRKHMEDNVASVASADANTKDAATPNSLRGKTVDSLRDSAILREGRVSFALTHGAHGHVEVSPNVVTVVACPTMLPSLLAGVPWGHDVVQLAAMAGFPARIQLRSMDRERLPSALLMVHGFGEEQARVWMTNVDTFARLWDALPADEHTVDSLFHIVPIMTHYLRFANTLCSDHNVGCWAFGSFVFTAEEYEALVYVRYKYRVKRRRFSRHRPALR